MKGIDLVSVSLYYLLGLGYTFLLAWGLFQSKKAGFFDYTNVLLLVIVGLIYDNVVIALGSSIGEGALLQQVSYARYWIHAFFTPTLILFAWSLSWKLQLPWAHRMYGKAFSFLLTIAVILYELLVTLRGLELEPNWENGVLTYESTAAEGIPVMVVVVTLFIAMTGVFLIKKFRFPWLLIGTAIMIGGGIAGAVFPDFPMMNGLEFIFIVSLLITRQFVIQQAALSSSTFSSS
ncbi:hypothetical protein [Alteribacillus iranensis]|nr:hypothetical protein [Alteribacillus iranensis]